jgi:hypothetical protein
MRGTTQSSEEEGPEEEEDDDEAPPPEDDDDDDDDDEEEPAPPPPAPLPAPPPTAAAGARDTARATRLSAFASPVWERASSTCAAAESALPPHPSPNKYTGPTSPSKLSPTRAKERGQDARDRPGSGTSVEEMTSAPSTNTWSSLVVPVKRPLELLW